MEKPSQQYSRSDSFLATTSALLLTAGSLLIGTGVELSRQSRAYAETHDTATAPAAPVPEQRFDVYPLTITTPDGTPTPGFSPVQKTPQELGQAVLDGWEMLRGATHDALEPGRVTVTEPLTFETPSITSAADLCDDQKNGELRQALLKMASSNQSTPASDTAKTHSVDDKPIIPVFVLEVSDTSPAGCTLTADSGPGEGIVAYESEYVDKSAMAHEAGHTQRLSHDNSDASGKIDEYGNNGTIMGDNWNISPTDPDILTAPDLLALGAIKPKQIVTLPPDSTESIELSTVSSDDGSTVAIRVPVGPLGGRKADSRLQCATEVDIELDTNAVADGDGDIVGYAHGISMEAVNGRPTPKDQWLSPTVLLPFAPGDYIQTYPTGSYPITVQLGKSTLTMYVASLNKNRAQLILYRSPGDAETADPAVCG